MIELDCTYINAFYKIHRKSSYPILAMRARAAASAILEATRPYYYLRMNVWLNYEIYIQRYRAGLMVTQFEPGEDRGYCYSSTSAYDLLDEFRDRWTNFGNPGRDPGIPHPDDYSVAHLFTNTNFDGAVVGLAWVKVACDGVIEQD